MIHNIRPFAYCLLFLLTACFNQDHSTVKVQLDHITFSINDLEKGMEEFEFLTGVKPYYGGQHKGGITHNALVDLGNEIYLEIKAPKDDAKTTPKMAQYKKYTSLTPTKWMIYSDNIKKTAKKLKKSDFAISGIYKGERLRPDNVLLKWKSFHLSNKNITNKPAFIQWKNMDYHPTKSLDDKCQLLDFTISDPKPEKLEHLTKALNLNTKIKKSETHNLSIKMKCPKGEVTFSS